MQDTLFKIGKQQVIENLSIQALFGEHSYSIPLSRSPIPNLTILYGRNGAGKTTLLRLAFGLLYPSASDHKQYIAHTPFKAMSIKLSNGVTIKVQKDHGHLLGPFSI